MAKRILWKKGMRLTDEVLTRSDKCTEELVSKSLVLGACGRMGLLPGSRQFEISIDINKDAIEVVSLDCLGLTRNGTLIDVQYDTVYTNSCDAHVDIPPHVSTDNRYYLCISALGGVSDTNDGLCDTLYGFCLVEEDTPIPDYSLPVARIVYDAYCWRSDDSGFVPPCLFVSSHFKYEELAQRFLSTLKEINAGLPATLRTAKQDAVKIFWPVAQSLMITMDKSRDTMTPMELLANMQQLAGAFYCACSLDESVKISDPAQYLTFVNAPYNYKDAYEIIAKGAALAYSINEKLNSFDAEPELVVEDNTIAAPSIEKGQLEKRARSGAVKVQIINNAPGATVYYTTDGSKPTKSSMSGTVVTIESGFADSWQKEPMKHITIKAVAYKDNTFSDIATFEVKIKKSLIPVDYQI